VEIAIIGVIVAAALAAVLYPLLARGAAKPGERLSEQALDEQVARYRTAIRKGTLCERCLTANSAHSRYCSDCGSALVR
jgi:hypothetical protein